MGIWRMGATPLVLCIFAALSFPTRGLVSSFSAPSTGRCLLGSMSGSAALCKAPAGPFADARGSCKRVASTLLRMSTVTKETRDGPLKEVAVSSSAPTVRQQSQGKKRAEGLLRAAIKDAVKLNHVEVASERPEEARPVLILHGLLGSSRNFASFTSELSGKLEKPRRFIIPDLRNHGDSSHARSMGYVSMAADVKLLLEELGIDKCCIIGHSMGGKVAATLALLFPEMIESVAILDIAPVSYSGQNGAASSKIWDDIHSIVTGLDSMPVETLKDKKEADKWLAQVVDDPLLRAFALTNLVRSKDGEGMKWKIGIRQIRRNLGIIGGFDLGQGLQRPASDLDLQFRRDTFFIQGGYSNFIRSTHLPEIRNLFPNFVVQTMRGAGHWVHSEDMEGTIKNVARFLDRENPTDFE